MEKAYTEPFELLKDAEGKGGIVFTKHFGVTFTQLKAINLIRGVNNYD